MSLAGLYNRLKDPRIESYFVDDSHIRAWFEDGVSLTLCPEFEAGQIGQIVLSKNDKPSTAILNFNNVPDDPKDPKNGYWTDSELEQEVFGTYVKKLMRYSRLLFRKDYSKKEFYEILTQHFGIPYALRNPGFKQITTKPTIK